MAPNGSDVDTERMLFPATDPKTLPLTENVKGAGLYYSNDFLVPIPIYFPDMRDINIPRVIKRIKSEVNPKWFAEEPYWKEP
ncbi:hypothetical protein R0Q57_00160 [Lactobacillus acidophilus]